MKHIIHLKKGLPSNKRHLSSLRRDAQRSLLKLNEADTNKETDFVHIVLFMYLTSVVEARVKGFTESVMFSKFFVASV